jgi:putative membrane protein
MAPAEMNFAGARLFHGQPSLRIGSALTCPLDVIREVVMRHRFGLVSAFAIAALMSGPVFAQQMRAAPPAHQLSRADMNFMKEAAIGGMAEVELGKLAQQNAKSDDVKQFGGRMVEDHGAANKDLATLADNKGMALPRQLDAKHAQLRDKLARLRGAEFDRAYMREMTKDHDKDVKAFRHQAQSAADPDLKQFAAKTAGVIEQHDKMAHDLSQSLTAVGSSRRPR